ncbi:uncharacterized protein LOC9647595 [Selaginella moellendorffii]|nr:uncharacterized protein LOC9647595 [Selaginella moellendorffii]|eukprot:XP_024542091.1 uncharacterized protein LOC9647595 [Selaginella moellendorffii]
MEDKAHHFVSKLASGIAVWPRSLGAQVAVEVRLLTKMRKTMLPKINQPNPHSGNSKSDFIFLQREKQKEAVALVHKCSHEKLPPWVALQRGFFSRNEFDSTSGSEFSESIAIQVKERFFIKARFGS